MSPPKLRAPRELTDTEQALAELRHSGEDLGRDERSIKEFDFGLAAGVPGRAGRQMRAAADRARVARLTWRLAKAPDLLASALALA